MSVKPSSNAQKAGFQKDDIIITVNEVELSSLTALIAILLNAKTEDPDLTHISIQIQRSGKEETLTIQIDE